MLVIGLTGGVGCGKSTVSKLFAEHQVPIIDADLIARELVEPGQPALLEMVVEFGDEILQHDGSLNRRHLRELVFSDADKRKKLENILHPLIRNQMLELLDQIDAPYVVLVVPLLVDTGNWDMIDTILVVDADEEIQLQRVMQRDHVDAHDAQAIIDSQISRIDRLEASDQMIDNNGDITDLREQVDALHKVYLSRANADNNHTTESIKQRGQVIYEQPLNERIRNLLKLEYLFQHVEHHLAANTPIDTHNVIRTLVDINNLISRGDIKSELIKELERQYSAFEKQAALPDADTAAIKPLLTKQAQCIRSLHEKKPQLGSHLQNDSLYNAIKQRLGVAGGTCGFDLPLYNYWLNISPAARTDTMQSWLEPYWEIDEAIRVCLGSIRSSGQQTMVTAEKGYYEQTINSGSDIQLLRAIVDVDCKYYPVISASKLHLNIRFLRWLHGEARSPQAEDNVQFKLVLCAV